MKKYIQPVSEIINIESNQQLMTGSITVNGNYDGTSPLAAPSLDDLLDDEEDE